MLNPLELGKKDAPRLLRIETLLIICQQHGAVCGNLRGLGKEEIIFSPHNNHRVADRFSAGFRWDGGFINIDELEKTREDNGGSERIIRARIRKIEPADKSALMKLLNGTLLS